MDNTEYQRDFASPIPSSVKMAGGKLLRVLALPRTDKADWRPPLMSLLLREIWLDILWVIDIYEESDDVDDVIYLIYYFRILNLNFILLILQEKII